MRNYQLEVDALNIEHKYYSGDGVVALCEFHDDTNPSMFVNLVEGNYYCYSCGAKGTAKELVQQTGGKLKYVPYNGTRKTKDNGEWRTFLSLPIAHDDPYLVNRGIDNDAIDRWGLRSSDRYVVIPLKKNDKVVGVKVRDKNAKKKVKYLTFGEQPTYIYNNVTDNKYFGTVVTEGMFGLIKYESLGIRAVSPVSVVRSVALKKLIEVKSWDKFVICFDPDISGYISTAKLLFSSACYGNIVSVKSPFDVDVLDEKNYWTYIPETFFNNTTRDYSYFVDITKKFGDDVYKTQKRLFKDFIKGYKI